MKKIKNINRNNLVFFGLCLIITLSSCGGRKKGLSKTPTKRMGEYIAFNTRVYPSIARDVKDNPHATLSQTLILEKPTRDSFSSGVTPDGAIIQVSSLKGEDNIRFPQKVGTLETEGILTPVENSKTVNNQTTLAVSEKLGGQYLNIQIGNGSFHFLPFVYNSKTKTWKIDPIPVRLANLDDFPEVEAKGRRIFYSRLDSSVYYRKGNTKKGAKEFITFNEIGNMVLLSENDKRIEVADNLFRQEILKKQKTNQQEVSKKYPLVHHFKMNALDGPVEVPFNLNFVSGKWVLGVVRVKDTYFKTLTSDYFNLNYDKSNSESLVSFVSSDGKRYYFIFDTNGNEWRVEEKYLNIAIKSVRLVRGGCVDKKTVDIPSY